ncbi:unnamed protein product [Somion occarium]|uniref:L domain-like protein n=1 Tax=Somion occarium TaxID=3059160 RepID=A0ABP1DWY9_9APHY
MTSETPIFHFRHSPDDRYPNFFSRDPNLSIAIPPQDFPVETSRFSPESPPLPPVPSRAGSMWTNATTMRSPTPKAKDVEANRPRSPQRSPSSPSSRFRARFTKLFFDVRTLMKDRDAELVPIQPAHLPPWQPLNVEKRSCCQDCLCHRPKERSRRYKLLICLLVIIILYLLGNVSFLNARVIKLSSSSTSTDKRTASTSKTLSADAQECLSQYNVNAPSDPSGYPCSSCLPVLQSVPSDFSDGNATDTEQIQNATQFCGLRAFFESMDNDGQAALQNGQWVENMRFCAWGGVSCDGAGRVGALTLSFPAVPATLPNEIGALTGLTSLHVIGNSNIPGGSLPSSFTSLKSMTLLHLESTAITALPDNVFSSLDQVTTVELVKNGQMGNDLPSSVTSLPLQNLIVNGQNLNNPLQTLSSSSSLQRSLQLLDLSSTSLSGSIPSSISSFSALVELHLDSNNLTNPLPSSFPSSLGALTLSNNSGLSGSVQGSFCSLGKLQNCEMTGTGLTAAGGCGVCRFS